MPKQLHVSRPPATGAKKQTHVPSASSFDAFLLLSTETAAMFSTAGGQPKAYHPIITAPTAKSTSPHKDVPIGERHEDKRRAS